MPALINAGLHLQISLKSGKYSAKDLILEYQALGDDLFDDDTKRRKSKSIEAALSNKQTL